MDLTLDGRTIKVTEGQAFLIDSLGNNNGIVDDPVESGILKSLQGEKEEATTFYILMDHSLATLKTFNPGTCGLYHTVFTNEDDLRAAIETHRDKQLAVITMNGRGQILRSIETFVGGISSGDIKLLVTDQNFSQWMEWRAKTTKGRATIHPLFCTPLKKAADGGLFDL